jgi:hypothetical protein
MTLANGTKYRAVVDTHRHPVGAELRDKMAEAGLFDPRKPLPQDRENCMSKLYERAESRATRRLRIISLYH